MSANAVLTKSTTIDGFLSWFVESSVEMVSMG